MKNKAQLMKMKQEQEKITMITAYDYPSAKLAEAAGIDTILVGDSLGMVVLGYDSTIKVTVDDMIHHASAVTRGAPDTFVIVDMPFMSYHISLADSLQNARRLFQETGAQAVKVEGASPETLQLMERLAAAGIPVVAHLGLTPQSVHVLGGYRVQGKDKATARKLCEEARAVEESGAMGLVLECVPEELAGLITSQSDLPVIGIGAGKDCDGQVLVYHDVLEYGVARLPKFAKSYACFNQDVPGALKQFIGEVKSRTFPDSAHSFTMDPTLLSGLKAEE